MLTGGTTMKIYLINWSIYMCVQTDHIHLPVALPGFNSNLGSIGTFMPVG